MTNLSLAQSCPIKAKERVQVFDVLMTEAMYSDLLRETQEIVELALKGMRRQVGIEPPHWPDGSGLILEHRDRFPEPAPARIEGLAATSKRLGQERELSFCGDLDFIPAEEYGREDACRTMRGAERAVRRVEVRIP